MRYFASERDMLLAWKEWQLEMDPDIIATFQVRDTLGALRDRFARLRLEGGGLLLSRLRGPASAPAPSPLTVHSVVTYSPDWVRRQGRMTSTSNQETFRADVHGRVTVDVLRQVTMSQSLCSFSLVDCCQALLDSTLEVLSPFHLARLAAEAQGGAAAPPPPHAASASVAAKTAKTSKAAKHTAPSQQQQEQQPRGGGTAAFRLASYAVRRLDVIVRLMERLATVPEMLEMARVTGLTLTQVLYNAQMIKTWSLLHRNAHRHNYIVGGSKEVGTLTESPFLMHPIDNKTAGLYRAPVATLDFASLYPSLFRAHNLCYTTLLHPDDVAELGGRGGGRCGFTPTGHAFVTHEVRPGILPSILAALMAARTATRAALKSAPDSAAAAVLDGRQKALKLAANALYGFTGAPASMLRCVPLADSCLALGAAACRKAIQVITAAVAEGRLTLPLTPGVGAGGTQAHTAPAAAPAAGAPAPAAPPSADSSSSAAAEGCRVIYAQTDSVFVHFPRATPLQAVALGRQAAALVSAVMPPPMSLQYERVMAPFLLLHVNRYAGRALEGEAQAAKPEARGTLLVKGVKSMWRQSAPLVRTVLQGCLERILLRDDVAAAVSYAEAHIHRLLSGRAELGELAMTGGLWRITGQQVAAAAAAEDDDEGGGGNGGGTSAAAAAAPAEDVKGPHASLAVRLSHRDPGRRFLLGERLRYVLLAGARTQDDAAEDPLAAAQRGAAPALDIYWRNKLQPPLKEVFSVCLPPSGLQALMNGPHTMVKVDAAVEAAGPSSAAEHGATASGGGGGGGATEAAAAAAGAMLLAGPGSPVPRRGGGNGGGDGGGGGGGAGFGLGMAPRSPPSVGKAKGGGGGGGSAGKSTQSGLSSFFRHTARCLACKQALSRQQLQTAGDDPSDAPGLCAACLADPDTLPSTLLRYLSEDSTATLTVASALSACAACHSGGHLGPVLCENGECGQLFARLGGARRMAAAGERVERLARCEQTFAAGNMGAAAVGVSGAGAATSAVTRALQW